MNSDYYYFSMENFDALLDESTRWRVLYNAFLNISSLEEWERRTIEDLILSEKVFDV